MTEGPSTLYRVTVAARLAGVPRQSLLDAVKAGTVRSVTTRCGLPLVTLEAVQHYRDHPPKRGRPKTKG